MSPASILIAAAVVAAPGAGLVMWMFTPGRASPAVQIGLVVPFGVAFVGAKTHAPGHSKGKAQPLGAPSSFEHAVRRSALQSGQIAPPAQPPAASSSTS